MGKNVAVFVDVANIFYAAKAAGVDIDYVTLLKAATASRDLVRAYAYTGLDPENENQRNFHAFLARSGYRVVSKDIRKYGDGKVKANLDIELVVDMMKTARNLDIAIVVSGDGDFAPAIRAVQEQGVRVEVISFRGNTSSDLMDVADQFTDIVQLAKVEKGSSRSGRRVATDEQDLSMTEVPDKQTEGTGDRRRGRGRGRGREDERPAARVATVGRREITAVTPGGAPLVVLPGEKLSRAASDDSADLVAVSANDPESGGALSLLSGGAAPAVASEGNGAGWDEEGEDAEGRRRRRRRGGRGRGRGRGREGVEGTDQPETAADGQRLEDAERFEDVERDAAVAEAGPRIEEDEEERFAAPRAPRTTPFGSVWDSQLGVPAPRTTPLEPLGDDEDFEEPAIPEYLIAERRNRGRGAGGPGGPGAGSRGGRNQGGRGGARGAYAAAMDRERYGRGGGGGGINRYPDVSARERVREPRRDDRPPRPARPANAGGSGNPAGAGQAPRGGGDEPWSEVPPELEAMLRAQLGGGSAQRQDRDRREPERGAPQVSQPVPDAAADEGLASEVVPDAAAAQAPTRRRRSTPRAESAAPGVTGDAAEDASTETAPRLRATRRTAGPAATTAALPEEGADAEAPSAPRRRTTRTRAAAADASATGDVAADATDATDAPKRRSTRRKAADAPATSGTDASAGGDDSEAAAEPAPKRRSTRRKATDEAPAD